MKWSIWLLTLLLAAGLNGIVRWQEDSRLRKSTRAALVELPLVEVSQLDRAHRIVIREKPQSTAWHSPQEGFAVRRVVEPNPPIRETVLERRGDTHWVVANCAGLEADPNWQGLTMRDLSQGQLVRYLTSDPQLMGTLELGVAHIRIESMDGRVLRELEFGRKDGGESYQFVRVDGRDAYLAKHQTELAGDPLSWIVSRVLRFQVDDIAAVEFTFQNRDEQSLVLQRTIAGQPFVPIGGDAWPNAGRVSDEVKKILRRLIAEPIVSVGNPELPAAMAARMGPMAQVKMKLFDSREYKVSYGLESSGKDPDNAVIFAFYECSDSTDLAARYSAKVALGYSREVICELLPASRAALMSQVSGKAAAAPR